MKTHRLKTWPAFFQAIVSGNKTFEARVNDRNFQVGDTLVLEEYDPTTQKYTGYETTRIVSYILTGKPWVCDGVVVMGIKHTPGMGGPDWQTGYDQCMIDTKKLDLSLSERIDELESVAQLRHKADDRAIARWREAHPDRQATIPDHADLCTWLMEKLYPPLNDTQRAVDLRMKGIPR